MHRSALLVVAGLAAAVGTAALAQPRPYSPGPQNVTVPSDWQTRFVRYATVDKPDRKIIRNIYINPESYAALRPGEPLPYGTIVVMADQRARLDDAGNPLRDLNGRMIPEPAFISMEVQRKERGWGEGYSAEQRNGEWEYARFDIATGQRRDGPVTACFTCHLQNRAQQDFTFTTWDYANRPR